MTLKVKGCAIYHTLLHQSPHSTPTAKPEWGSLHKSLQVQAAQAWQCGMAGWHDPWEAHSPMWPCRGADKQEQRLHFPRVGQGGGARGVWKEGAAGSLKGPGEQEEQCWPGRGKEPGPWEATSYPNPVWICCGGQWSVPPFIPAGAQPGKFPALALHYRTETTLSLSRQLRWSKTQWHHCWDQSVIWAVGDGGGSLRASAPVFLSTNGVRSIGVLRIKLNTHNFKADVAITQ